MSHLLRLMAALIISSCSNSNTSNTQDAGNCGSNCADSQTGGEDAHTMDSTSGTMATEPPPSDAAIATGDAAAPAASACPSAAPAADSSCQDEGRVCAYGSERPSCRPALRCTAGRWQAQPAPPQCEQLPDSCPPEPPATGDGCNVVGGPPSCIYDDGVACQCVPARSSCGGPQGAMRALQWSCTPPFPCPASAPMNGSTCSTADLTCVYLGNCRRSDATCKSGAWQVTNQTFITP